MHYIVSNEKWKVEHITDKSSNILIDESDKKDEDKDKEPVGMGFPIKLAERIVRMHNDSLEKISKKFESLEETYSYPAG